MGPIGSSRRIFLHGQCHIFCPPTVIIFYILPKYLLPSNFHSKYFLMSINWCIIIFHRSQFLINKMTGFYLQEILQPENSHLLERSFTVRFRCLLDNTSGFLVNLTYKMFYKCSSVFSFQRLDIRGKIKPLHGQNRKTEEPLALFCICTPFGPPSLLEMPQKEVMFKSKHKLDLGNVSFEQRGKDLFGYNETEFSSKGIYDLVHPEDLSYVAQAHSECK